MGLRVEASRRGLRQAIVAESPVSILRIEGFLMYIKVLTQLHNHFDRNLFAG